MHGSRLGLTAAAALLSGCAASPAAPPPQASAVACPEHVAEAEAWINRMPGVRVSPRQLVVSARLADSAANALLLRSADSTSELLVLDIRSAGAVPVPGRAGYREPAPEKPYSRILLRCRGVEDFSIHDIAVVY